MHRGGKHLLEAFKVAGPSTTAPTSAPPPAPSSTSSSAASRPAAPKGGASAPHGHSPHSQSPLSQSLAAKPAATPRGALLLNAAQVRLLGLIVLLAVVVAFLLGRASVSRVAEASGEPRNEPSAVERVAPPANTASSAAASAPAQPAQTPPAQPAAVDPNPRTPAELALLDPANVYTVKAVHYSNTEANRRLAADAANYMIRTHGLPAVVAADGSGLYILVGAAPRMVDLDDFLARVKQMPGPPPLSRAGEFQTAFVEKIDRVFKREK